MLIEKVLKLEEQMKNDLQSAKLNAQNLIKIQEDEAKKWAAEEYRKWQEELAKLTKKQASELDFFTNEMAEKEKELIAKATKVSKKDIDKQIDLLVKQVVK